jgi:hypothetical protein
MRRQTVAETETTAAGLAALTRHIAKATAKGELDPEFVRKLGKRIAKEYEVMLESGAMDSEEAAELLAAMDFLGGTAVAGEGKLLSKALLRLRAADAERGAKPGKR